MAKIYLSGVGSVGWLYSDYDASLTSNWTELEWTGTELGKMILSRLLPEHILLDGLTNSSNMKLILYHLGFPPSWSNKK